MELYYSPMACSLAARIVCLEGGLDVVYRRADLATKRVEGRGDGALREVTALGKVPALVLDDGTVLTENAAVLLYLGDRAGADRGLAPREGTFDRYETLRWLSFVGTEVHKRVLATVFSLDDPPEAACQFARDGAAQPLAVLDGHLRARSFLVGDRFSVADAYLVWACALLPLPRVRVPLEPYPHVLAYAARHVRRESVKEALRIEREQYRAPGWWTANSTPPAPRLACD